MTEVMPYYKAIENLQPSEFFRELYSLARSKRDGCNRF
jgi:hypothetical protein